MLRNSRSAFLFRGASAVLLALFTALTTSCGGGGGGSGGGGGGGAIGRTLFVDTASGATASLVVRVLGVSAERIDGELSANLLREPVSVTLVDPRGSTVGLSIAEPPAGAPHAALRLLLDPAASRSVLADGSQVSVRLPGAELRVAAPDGFAANDGKALELVHATPPTFTPAAGGPTDVTLDLALRASQEVAVQGVLARVMTVDVAARRVLAELLDLGGRNATVEFGDDSVLLGLDGGRRGVDDFLRECGPGSEIRLDGRRRSDDSYACRAGEHERRGGSRELKFTGRVGSIDATARRFTLDAYLRRPAGGREEPWFGTVIVDGGNAVIRRELGSSTYTAASFGDLQVGQVVEAEGVEDSTGVLIAREVDIEDESGSNGSGEIEGAVRGIDVAAGTIDVRQRGDDPLIVGGQRVPQLTVRVGPSTYLFRDDREERPIQLGEVRTTDRIWIRGTVASDGSVDARWVRVRDDS